MTTDNPLSNNPIAQFQVWWDEIIESKKFRNPGAFCLSTVNPDGQPAGRILLLRGVSDAGFEFYTNTHSNKSQDLDQNPNAAMTFYWEPFGRQVRVQGTASMMDDTASDAYFAKRPRLSQIGAWASDQSAEIPNRAHLNHAVEDYTAKFDGQDVPRPPHWKGYCLDPHTIEFWIEGEGRLHDRFVYIKQDPSWTVRRLAP